MVSHFLKQLAQNMANAWFMSPGDRGLGQAFISVIQLQIQSSLLVSEVLFHFIG